MVLPKDNSLVEAEQAINNVLRIKTFVQSINPLFLALATARSTLLERVRALCRPEMTSGVLGLISDTINDDVIYVDSPLDLRNQRTYAVKARWTELRTTREFKLTFSRPASTGYSTSREKRIKRLRTTFTNMCRSLTVSLHLCPDQIA